MWLRFCANHKKKFHPPLKKCLPEPLRLVDCPQDSNTSCEPGAIRTPVNVSASASFLLNRTHHEAALSCEAILELGPLGPRLSPAVISRAVSFSVYCKLIFSCPRYSLLLPYRRLCFVLWNIAQLISSCKTPISSGHFLSCFTASNGITKCKRNSPWRFNALFLNYLLTKYFWHIICLQIMRTLASNRQTGHQHHQAPESRPAVPRLPRGARVRSRRSAASRHLLVKRRWKPLLGVERQHHCFEGRPLRLQGRQWRGVGRPRGWSGPKR